MVATIEDLSHDGRGVARIDGKAVFVHDALPGEQVSFRYTSQRRDFDEAVAEQVLEASPERVVPRCPHVGVCGGCVLQHLDPVAQIERKQGVLLENLRRIGKVAPERVLAPLTASPWGYRRRARLSVRYVGKKQRTLVGFRERGGRFVADLQECHVLVEPVGLRIAELAALVDRLEARRDIAQIEIAAGDDVSVLVMRNLQPLGAADRQVLAAFEARTGLRIVLQPGGLDSLEPLAGDMPRLSTTVDGDLELMFTPNNFVQVNAAINQQMIDLALDLLELAPAHRVLDLFCGLGNFTLPIARRVARVDGVEGDAALVQLARDNAGRNGIDNAAFRVEDLTGPVELGRYDRVLIDPPRSGARDVLEQVAATGAQRLVYVSCHPGTLARDAGVLVTDLGFRLIAAGAMDMFPHTAHVESIAVFDRSSG